MKVDVLLGLQWGDEGKGKVVDVLTPKYDVVARFQGGPNAGHTLEFNGEKYVLRSIPSGIFQGGKINVIGNGVVLDPLLFKQEAEALMLELLRQNDSRLGRATAFLLWTECIKQGRPLSPATKAAMQAAALRQADSDASLFERRVAIQALRFPGRQQTDQAKALLEAIETRMKTHEEPSIWEDLYNDLKFEFDN